MLPASCTTGTGSSRRGEKQQNSPNGGSCSRNSEPTPRVGVPIAICFYFRTRRLNQMAWNGESWPENAEVRYFELPDTEYRIIADAGQYKAVIYTT
jgi:hypothetical protein